jgi:hypothetical protein
MMVEVKQMKASDPIRSSALGKGGSELLSLYSLRDSNVTVSDLRSPSAAYVIAISRYFPSQIACGSHADAHVTSKKPYNYTVLHQNLRYIYCCCGVSCARG